MYDTSLDVHPPLLVDLKIIVLVLASILLAVIGTAESDMLLWHATYYTDKPPGN